MNVEAVEQTYWRNPILRYTQHPLHSPLLPLPYGDVSIHCEFSALQLLFAGLLLSDKYKDSVPLQYMYVFIVFHFLFVFIRLWVLLTFYFKT